MSATFSVAAALDIKTSVQNGGDITKYLEDLADGLKNNDRHRPEGEANHWALINRVLAYAASAEQHIFEQQARIRELENLSSTDELTGLHNRRSLKEFLDREISLARRHGNEGIVAFLDIDRFKQINDTFGHDAGDKMLQKIAEVLAANLRDTDFIARLGGDEFVFVLTNANQKDGFNRARQIQETLCDSTVQLRDGDTPLSVSMGLAAFDRDSSYDRVLRAADLSMYKNKRERRQAGAARALQ
ncbi:GGDEF domain-containing protein [Sneathiella chinensis]|uniref:diguanylate cyclase n=1 Tax=Sneathiella chinensis TaxID=349750 RepID=A0ABQ5U7B8_9PROT|nr:GGDEF domain-containing protein [Sneathiella chinensis]GLQ07681.1 hypothetical protein GCM10007924_29020 [Sneathiella chinensis]